MSTRKVWLGQQDALYHGLRWHLIVGRDYHLHSPHPDEFFPIFPKANQFPAQVTLPPNTGGGEQIPLAQELTLYNCDDEGFWMTDFQRCTGYQPKMYGFDLSRVSELTDTPVPRPIDLSQMLKVFINNFSRKKRAGYDLITDEYSKPGLKHDAEFAVMRDLLISTWMSNGEITISHHMLNPFMEEESGLNPEDLFDLFRPMDHKEENSKLIIDEVNLNDLESFAEKEKAIEARQVIISRGKIMGDMIKELIMSPKTAAINKDVYVRPFHEMNIDNQDGGFSYWWWGASQEAVNSTASNAHEYYHNFRTLWNIYADAVFSSLNELNESQKARVKFVLSPSNMKKGKINDDSGAKRLRNEIDKLLPPSNLSPSDETLTKFKNYVHVLGFDFYQHGSVTFSLKNESNKIGKETIDFKKEELYKQYLVIANSAKTLDINHALTEVGILIDGKGKLYSSYGGKDGWANGNWKFFSSIVGKTCELPDENLDRPLWVLFWGNQIQNIAFDGFNDNDGNLIDARTEYYKNVFADGSVEIFLPAHHQTQASTMLSGQSIPLPDAYRLSENLFPGFQTDPENANAYLGAVLDFSLFVEIGMRSGILDSLSGNHENLIHAPCPHAKASLKDKYLGMLKMGAFGDALGVGHEMDGLGGKVSTDQHTEHEEYMTDLRTLSQYANREDSETFGIWPWPDDRNFKGMISDDTSIRLTIVHAWLQFVEANPSIAITDLNFENWLKDTINAAVAANSPFSPLETTDSVVYNRRKWAAESIAHWYWQKSEFENLPSGHGRGKEIVSFDSEKHQSFFEGDKPIIFGLFLFLEVAAIYGCCSRESIYQKFENFSYLDQSEANETTGLLATILGQAICNTTSQNFSDFFFNEVNALKNNGYALQIISDVEFGRGKVTEVIKNWSEDKFTREILKQEIYDGLVSSPVQGFEQFYAPLFMRMIGAAVSYGNNDALKILRVLANGPGDSDTIPSFLGSIIGAFYGDTGLQGLTYPTYNNVANPNFQSDLQDVVDTTESYFPTVNVNNEQDYTRVNFDDIADTLVTLAAIDGCCAPDT